MIPWLYHHKMHFPPVESALREPNGLLAAGGDLSPERLLAAYRKGIFPWFNEGEPILWWCPDPRCVMIPQQLHISRSLRKAIRRGQYTVTFDRAFTDVIDGCAAPRAKQADTWITGDMRSAYLQLFKLHHAHSVEVWHGDELVGGLYGIAIGRIFFGESMFSRRPNTSKIAFAYLVTQLQKWGYPLIDCQVENEHLLSLGASLIPRREFQHILSEHLHLPEPENWIFDQALFTGG